MTLPERIEKRPLPEVELIDMRQEFLDTRKQSTFSRALITAVEERLNNGEQTMLTKTLKNKGVELEKPWNVYRCRLRLAAHLAFH